MRSLGFLVVVAALGCGSTTVADAGAGGAQGGWNGEGAGGQLPAATGIWGHVVSETGTQRVEHVAVDAQRYVYLAGSFEGELRFQDAVVASEGEADVFVAKLTPAGELLWLQRFGDAQGQAVRALAVGEHVYFGGSYEGAPSVEGQTLPSSPGYGWYLVSLDLEDGTPRWHAAEPYTATGTTSSSLAVTGITAVGSSVVVATRRPGLGAVQSTLRGFDAATGEMSVEREVGPVSIGAMTASTDGDVLISGTLFGDAEVLGVELPGAPSPGAGDLVVVRVDPSLDLVLGAVLDADYAYARGVVELGEDVYVAGYVHGPLTVGGVALPHRGQSDAMLVRFSPQLEAVQGRTIGGDSGDAFLGLAAGRDHVVAVGHVLEDVSLAGATPVGGGTDALMVRFALGDLSAEWVRRGGGEDNQRLNTVAIDAAGRITAGGVFRGDLGLGVPLTSTDGQDGFVLQLSP